MTWLAFNRRLLAVAGLAGLIALTVAGEGSLTDRIANSALIALAVATLFGYIEVQRGNRASPSSEDLKQRAVTAHLWALGVVVFASALLAQTWFQAGTSIAAGDTAPPNGTAWLSRVFDPYGWSGSNLGGPPSLELQLPWAAVLAVVTWIGGSAELAQRLWYTALFAGAAGSVAALLLVLGLKPVPAIIGTGAYLFNPYVVTVVNTNPVYLAGLGLLAALPAILLAAASGRIRIRTGCILLGACAPMVGWVYENPPLAGLVIGGALATPLLAWWLYGRSGALRCATTFGIGFALMTALSAYWIVPVAFQVGTSAFGHLSSVSSWSWTEVRATVRNAFWLNTAWGWRFPEYFPFAMSYESLPVSFLRFIVPTLAFGALLITGQRKDASEGIRIRSKLPLAVAATTIALVFIFLSTGTNPPGNAVFNPLYSLPFGWLLREPGRFLMGTALAYSILIAVFVESLGVDWLPSVAHKFAGLAQMRLRHGWIMRVAICTALSAIVIAPGFPLATGAIAADNRQGLPSPHVRFPSYWTEMARATDQSPVSGRLLVLPVDDFYQMPYKWGYYGNDGFIANLFTREVLVPTGQGYGPAPQQLLDAVALTSDSILGSRWDRVQQLLALLRSPLVLVRGDVDWTFPGRKIQSPIALAQKLEAAPNLELVYRAGPLELFALRSQMPPQFERVSTVATVDTASPDLRVLSLLDSGTALVTSSPRPGLPSVAQAPPISDWPQEGAALVWSASEFQGRDYRLSAFGSESGASDQLGVSKQLPQFVETRSEDQPSGNKVLKVRLLGKSILTDGDFRHGLWNPVGDCYNLLGDAGLPFLAGQVIPDKGPGGLPALRLSARADSACEAQWANWQGGSVVLTLKIHHVAGALPRLCLWEAGINRCVDIPPLPEGPGWLTYRTVVTPETGTTALALFLYADAGSPGPETVNEYAGAGLLEVPLLPQFVLVGTPTTRDSSAEVLVLKNAYSDLWQGPLGEHVYVNGIFNGWLTSNPQKTVKVRYVASVPIQAGFAISVMTVLLLLIAALAMLGVRLLKQRGP